MPFPHAVGVEQGEAPALMQGTEVNVYCSYCQMPCGHGVGSGGLQPLFSGIGLPLPSHHGGAGGLEALKLR